MFKRGVAIFIVPKNVGAKRQSFYRRKVIHVQSVKLHQRWNLFFTLLLNVLSTKAERYNDGTGFFKAVPKNQMQLRL